MKILVVGNGTSKSRFSDLLQIAYPDAEIVRQEPNGPRLGMEELEYIWYNEVASIPCREKVMHPWSRRKKK